MRDYYVYHTDSDNIDWKKIPELQIDQHNAPLVEPVKAIAQICWSEEEIHVHMSAWEMTILARFTGDNDMVCQDSCLEMFIRPDKKDGRYFNIEVNPNGACYFGFGYGRDSLIRLQPSDIRSLLSIRTIVQQDFWEITYAFPVKLIRMFMPDFSLYEGRAMYANFYKCGDDIHPNHELMWNLITNGNDDFHQPEFFGRLICL